MDFTRPRELVQLTATSDEPTFGFALEAWLRGQQSKTVGSLVDALTVKVLSLPILVLMLLPALPLPLGGVTRVFELLAMPFELALLAGRLPTLPDQINHWSLAKLATNPKALTLVAYLKHVERFTRPRLASWLQRRLVVSGLGALMLGFTMIAFLAPPFFGLDTLPALGVEALALALLFEDALLLLLGVALGGAGVALVAVLDTLVYRLF